jgi:hypothetical protein
VVENGWSACVYSSCCRGASVVGNRPMHSLSKFGNISLVKRSCVYQPTGRQEAESQSRRERSSRKTGFAETSLNLPKSRLCGNYELLPVCPCSDRNAPECRSQSARSGGPVMGKRVMLTAIQEPRVDRLLAGSRDLGRVLIPAFPTASLDSFPRRLFWASAASHCPKH